MNGKSSQTSQSSASAALCINSVIRSRTLADMRSTSIEFLSPFFVAVHFELLEWRAEEHPSFAQVASNARHHVCVKEEAA